MVHVRIILWKYTSSNSTIAITIVFPIKYNIAVLVFFDVIVYAFKCPVRDFLVVRYYRERAIIVMIHENDMIMRVFS